MPPAHILADAQDIAEVAIISGDAARVEQLSGLLSETKLVNSNRGFVTYTGFYGKKRLTIAAHGIGAPSIAIVVEELRMLGAKRIIRFGTAGGLIRGLGVGDLVVPTSAAFPFGTLKEYGKDGSRPASPDEGLTKMIAESCKRAKLKFREGVVYSADHFYTQTYASLEPWVSKGVIAVEMECATLFTIGAMEGFKTGGLLMLSNSLVNKKESELATAKTLKPFAEKAARALFEGLSRA